MEPKVVFYNPDDFKDFLRPCEFFKPPKRSDWKCYMFGNTPETNDGILYQPKEGCEPNWFVRWMMKICFDCTWVKDKQ
jgi:hypothetical protein